MVQHEIRAGQLISVIFFQQFEIASTRQQIAYNLVCKKDHELILNQKNNFHNTYIE